MTTISEHKTLRAYLIRLLIPCALSVATLLIAACGGGGGSTSAGGVTTTAAPPATALPVEYKNSFDLTNDTYGTQKATYLSATSSDGAYVLRTAIASSMTDPGFKSIFRIDIKQPAAITENAAYAVGGETSSLPTFPGDIYIFNGHPSTMIKVVSGAITFTSLGRGSDNIITGNFNVQAEDQNPAISPRTTYMFAATFSFALDSYGAIIPTPLPVPASGAALYDSRCASCHMLGDYDQTSNGAPDLSLKGGITGLLFTAGITGHQGVLLSAPELKDLRIFLNAQ